MMSDAAPHLAQLPGEVPNGMPRYRWVSVENSNALKLKPNAGDGSDDQMLLGEGAGEYCECFLMNEAGPPMLVGPVWWDLTG